MLGGRDPIHAGVEAGESPGESGRDCGWITQEPVAAEARNERTAAVAETEGEDCSGEGLRT